MVESGVDLVKSSVDGGVVRWWPAGRGVDAQGGEWAEETRAQLDQQHAQLEPEGSEAVAATGPQAFDQAFGAQLAQVVAQLAESVVAVGELVAGERLRHADDAVVVQLQARH